MGGGAIRRKVHILGRYYFEHWIPLKEFHRSEFKAAAQSWHPRKFFLARHMVKANEFHRSEYKAAAQSWHPRKFFLARHMVKANGVPQHYVLVLNLPISEYST
ncbi:hypothetical protein L484_012379 [Morus notabilis]|uniref:Uncharacterized protein n=1 Tax=Morus notabilis TaxID=981085 RepID=W9S934_9ROSA|nr:hypothetical protein L484_012379 [Morus notabilis]